MSEPPHEERSRRPRSRLTARVRRDVLVDRTAFGLVSRFAARRPDPAVVARVREEVAEALDLFDERGWIADPASYHQAPAPAQGVRTRRRGSSAAQDRTTITWDDGYRCDPDEPGAERFAGYTGNRIARAELLAHPSEDRPWLVCIHGFGMGTPGLDTRALRAGRLYGDLGLNLAFLTLPFHGRRGNSRLGVGLPDFPGVDMLDNLHGLAQGVWDARQLLGILQERTDRPIGVLGLSLGGCVAALVASLDDVETVVLLAPLVDLTTVMADQAERLGQQVLEDVEVLEQARPVLGPVSPRCLTPRVPVERRFIVAGTLDQFVRPSTQVVPLSEHWDHCTVHWYHGGHVSGAWDRQAQAAIIESLRRSGLA